MSKLDAGAMPVMRADLPEPVGYSIAKALWDGMVRYFSVPEHQAAFEAWRAEHGSCEEKEEVEG